MNRPSLAVVKSGEQCAAKSSYALSDQGIATSAEIKWNLLTAPLVEEAIRNGEGLLAKDGPLVVATGKHTGRSAKDKFIVRDATTEDTIGWGDVNIGMTPAHFAALKADSSLRSATRRRSMWLIFMVDRSRSIA